jgi:hypothetical protein
MMRPAFSSTGQAAGFALMLAILLTLPLTFRERWLPSGEQSFCIPGWENGPYPWIHNQIFEEKGDIDLLFIGSSRIWNAIYTPSVQEQLAMELGHMVVVRTFAWGGAGYDALFYITRELLKHRRVKMIVFSDENNYLLERNRQLPFWLRWPDDRSFISGLPFRQQAEYYLASLIGMPNNLICLLRPNQPGSLMGDLSRYFGVYRNSPNPATQLGCLSSRKIETQNAPDYPYTEYYPVQKSDVKNNGFIKADRLADFKTLFPTSNSPIPEWQLFFATAFGELMQNHGVRACMIYIPVLAAAKNPTMPQRVDWTRMIPGITLMGVPPTIMFQGIPRGDLELLFADTVHLNSGGQRLFTESFIRPLINEYRAHCAEK